MTSTRLSVLAISFNCWEHLNTCLRSILASDYPVFEIVVIDNASIDGTVDKLRAAYPTVEVIQNSENVGHTKAVNQGLRLVKGQRVLLLDADTELRPDAISRMSAFLDEHPGAYVVAPRLLNPDGTTQYNARNLPSAMSGLFGRQSLLTRLFPNNVFSRRYLALDQRDTQTPFRAEHVGATCMLFNGAILDKVGMWDEGYHSYWVDADWCKSVLDAGGSIYCIPKAVVFHHDQNSRFLKKSPIRIIKFHAGAYRFYCLHRTRGRWDPRRPLAAVLLAVRTLLLLGLNMFKNPVGSQVDPLSQTRPAGRDSDKTA
jgi:N-acetylglucosaminyl-diphospho-decaprenol L-rhamnosyltransferase